MTPPVVLAIAATDPGGGAGLAADLATFAALGVHGACVVTAVTVQDTLGVHAVHPLPAELVAAQIAAVLDDLPVAVVKTGMLASAEIVEVVVASVASRSLSQGRPRLVVDPVLRASTGTELADEEVRRAYRDLLIPVATVVTPNEDEFAALGRPDQPGVVVTRGGDIETTNDHGTGCTYASALAAYLAHGTDIPTAAARAAAYVTRQLNLSRPWDLGRGRGPVAHISTSPITEGVTP
ncbi:bifunctional hydroxymethylpyrimidine kinase/phosphomethylpyrimidine kinase [Nocardioides antri]|uniref:Bifunctional hydroxymethylpyrimidine kinase/phosphomethylpyrimidine kinase n=1 Tax=Nocardioides antri TaxID=2607659 RepID=A0A5B1M346_9ACTN|nr:bifunctional hydroxymethylpyrimidine kinase/phosphomethylpyrimidine kinase [Nocardioides antri]KAA1427343.1 bifunctional hydroxymethylpyrimidine kinase/phosphomethylpyrimidine kinase [Nocardioides antri]